MARRYRSTYGVDSTCMGCGRKKTFVNSFYYCHRCSRQIKWIPDPIYCKETIKFFGLDSNRPFWGAQFVLKKSLHLKKALDLIEITFRLKFYYNIVGFNQKGIYRKGYIIGYMRAKNPEIIRQAATIFSGLNMLIYSDDTNIFGKNRPEYEKPKKIRKQRKTLDMIFSDIENLAKNFM